MQSSLEDLCGYSWYGAIKNIVSTIASFESAIVKTTKTLEQLNRSIDLLSHKVSARTLTVDVKQEELTNIAADNIDAFFHPDRVEENQGGSKPNGRRSTGTPEFSQFTDQIGDFAEGFAGIVEVLGKSNSKLGKLKKPLEVIGATARASSAAASLYEGMAGGMAITEGVLATGEFLSAGLMLTELLSGPVGWAVLAGSVALGGISKYQEMEERQRNDALEQKASEKQREKMLSTFRMSSADSDDYVNKRIVKLTNSVKVTEGSGLEWKLEDKVRPKVLKEYGRDAYGYIPDPRLATIDNNYASSGFIPELVGKNEDLPKAQKTYAQRTTNAMFELRHAAHTGGRDAFDAKVVELMAKAVKYDYLNNTNTAKDIRFVSQEAAFDIQSAANAGKKEPATISLPGFMGKNTQENRGGNSISINMSKPMIGQFTINCNSADEGINEFKHKVEKALLEILDSANVIN